MPTPPPSSTAPEPIVRTHLGWRNELLLALLPTATVLGLLWLLHLFSNQQLLFASLASSAFLIYLDPTHRTNSVRTLIISQIAAAAIGYLLHLGLGPGYASAALALLLTIGLMILTDTMHPPAVGTALSFAFRAGGGGEGNLLLFGLAVGLVVALLLVQQGTAYVFRRLTRHTAAQAAK